MPRKGARFIPIPAWLVSYNSKKMSNHQFLHFWLLLFFFSKDILKYKKKFRTGKPFCMWLQSQQEGRLLSLLNPKHLTLCFNKVLLTKPLCERTTLTFNISSNLGQNSDQEYFIYPLNFTHLFISHLWIQQKIQVNFFSKLDFSNIKANSQKLVIWCKSILITDCQLQDVLRRKAEMHINGIFWDYWGQKKGLARVSMQPLHCSMWTDSCSCGAWSSVHSSCSSDCEVKD